MEDKQEYIFNTKFASDKYRNGEKVIIIKEYGNGQLLIRFLKDKKELKVYDHEIREQEK